MNPFPIYVPVDDQERARWIGALTSARHELDDLRAAQRQREATWSAHIRQLEDDTRLLEAEITRLRAALLLADAGNATFTAPAGSRH